MEKWDCSSAPCLIALCLIPVILFSFLGWYVMKLEWVWSWLVAEILLGIAFGFFLALFLFVLSLLMGKCIVD